MALRSKLLSVTAVSVALALTGAACGGDSDDGAASSGSASTDTVTAIPALTGIGTSVRIDPGTAGALRSLGVTLAPLGSAKFDAGTSTITFPITSGYAEIHSDLNHKPGYILGSIEHAGSGFSLSAGNTKVELSDFIVDPGNSQLYGTVGGQPEVPLLFLDGTNVKVTTESGVVMLDGTVAKLTDTAASALNKAFGTTALAAGLPLGVVHLEAKGDITSYDTSKDKVTAISRLSGDRTAVRLDPGTASALQQLGVSVAPVGSATFDAGTSTVAFPITGGFAAIHSDRSYKPGYVAGTVLHQASGLKFSARNGRSLEVTDFVVDPGNSVLTATAGGKSGIPLLFLDGTDLKVSAEGPDVVLDGTVAKLTDTAASTLNTTFGVTAFQAGMPLGVVNLVANGS